MRMLKLLNFGCTAALAMVVLAGCASFKNNLLPKIDAVETTAGADARPSLTYRFTAESDMFGRTASPEMARRMMSEEFRSVLQDSGYFQEVSEAAEGTDWHMDATILNSGNPAALIPAFITGFSFYTIPSWATDHWTLTVELRMSDERQFSYVLKDSSVLVQWLPMIFFMPFQNPFILVPEVRKNMHRNLLARMRDDGILPPAPPTPGNE